MLRAILAPDSRFLVSIPTPFNAVSFYAPLESQPELLPAYEEAARVSVAEIQDAIPHTDLAIQWDLPTELATVEG
jgi:hypothetical protein